MENRNSYTVVGIFAGARVLAYAVSVLDNPLLRPFNDELVLTHPRLAFYFLPLLYGLLSGLYFALALVLAVKLVAKLGLVRHVAMAARSRLFAGFLVIVFAFLPGFLVSAGFVYLLRVYFSAFRDKFEHGSIDAVSVALFISVQMFLGTVILVLLYALAFRLATGVVPKKVWRWAGGVAAVLSVWYFLVFYIPFLGVGGLWVGQPLLGAVIGYWYFTVASWQGEARVAGE